MSVPYQLADIRNKIRRITGKLNSAELSDVQIDQYINTAYIFDLSEHLRLESFRYNYQFTTNANQAVYDFPKELYLTCMPPCYVGGYQSYMTQSRENFFRTNAQMTQFQQRVSTGTGVVGPYTFTLQSLPIVPGFKRNPPGAYSVSSVLLGTDVPASSINYTVIISGLDANGMSQTLVDDGGCIATGHSNIGQLFNVNDTSTILANSRGTINYITGLVQINAVGFSAPIAVGAAINAQYTPYVASRPRSLCFFQDQLIAYPIPDQAYIVSFEAYKYPTAFLSTAPPVVATQEPQLRELWQLLAYMAADKIFTDCGDIESMSKYRPILEEQMKLVQRRTIVQQTQERVATIYSDASGNQFPWGNMFGGF